MAGERPLDHEGILVNDLRELAAALGSETFLATYPDPWLITLGALDAIHEAGGGERTRAALPRGLAGATGQGIRVPPSARAWAVRKHLDTFPSKITLGRTGNNDIAITHPSISKFHAFFSFTDAGVCIHEAGSTNASLVNGVRITTELKPRHIDDLDVLQFGAGPEMLFVAPTSILNVLRGGR